MRLEISTEISVWRVPPSSGASIVLTVGSESSSATKGSSVESVAGKNRAPAKPWPYAALVKLSSHAAQIVQKSKTRCFMTIPAGNENNGRDFACSRASMRRVAHGIAVRRAMRTVQHSCSVAVSSASAEEERRETAGTHKQKNRWLNSQAA